MIEVRACELQEGDMVDLEDGEFFHPEDPDAPDLTEFELGVVGEVVKETNDIYVVEFVNIGTAGYSPDHIFQVLRPEAP